MYCPNCGDETSAEQKFCRSCGLGLEKVVQALVEQLPAESGESLRGRKNVIERLAVAALSVFGAGILGLILYGSIYRVMVVQGRLFEGVGLLAFLSLVTCGLLSVYLFAKAEKVKEAATGLRAGESRRPPVGEATAKLLTEGCRGPTPGVTERTTELLFAGQVRTAKEGSSGYSQTR